MRSKITYFGWGYLAFFTLISLLVSSCHSSADETPIFEVLDAKHTGIEFSNDLHPDQSFNMFHYMYYYNGAGVGTGDFNNDGWIDVFTRDIYKDVFVDSLQYCIKNKGLVLHAWVIMTNHVHLIISSDKSNIE